MKHLEISDDPIYSRSFHPGVLGLQKWLHRVLGFKSSFQYFNKLNINHICETLIRQLIKLKKLIVVSIILWCRHTYLNTQDEYEGKRTFDGIDWKS